MPLPIDPSNVFTIVTPTTLNIPVGSICYLQKGTLGMPKGLLLSLTTTPLYIKVIQTNNGFQGVENG